MRRFPRHFQAGRDGALRVLGKLRRAHLGDDLLGRGRDLSREFGREKNGRLRDAEIDRPALRFVRGAQEFFVALGSEVGVKAGAQFRVHAGS